MLTAVSSQVLCSEAFPFDEKVENKFYHADEITVAEAIQRPKHSRITIKGVVESVSIFC